MNESTSPNEAADMAESLAMLQMLEASSADVDAGNVRDSEDVFNDARRMIAAKRAEQE